LLNLRSKLLRPNYETGATYRPGMAVAAIYSDGTTFGDRKVLAGQGDPAKHRNIELYRISDFWPASTDNIPPHSGFSFQAEMEGNDLFDRFQVTVIDVKRWSE
jgi:hypothetical protein